MFTVDQVIRDNYPAIEQKPWLAKPLKGVLRRLLHERDINNFAETYPHLNGLDFVEKVLDYFSFSYSISDRDKARIPATGRVVIIANHPIGSLDGLALLKMVAEIRSDVKAVVNELLMNVKPLTPMLLPVNNMTGNTAKECLQNIEQHLRDDGALIIFPAGEVSRLHPTGVKDSRWRSGFLKMATQTQSPIVPMFVNGRNSALFYSASMIYKPLSTVLLVKEMFRQRNKNMTVRVGEPIPYESYTSLTMPNRERIKLFKRHLYRIGKGRKGLFKTFSAIAHPESRAELKHAIEQCERLGETADGKQIYLYRFTESSPIMREIGRLREVSFRAVGEGTGERRDMDCYDAHYLHLVLWDQQDLEIVGAYRLADTQRVIEEKGLTGLYTHSLFNFDKEMDKYLPKGVELGRSFVQPRYWGKRSLDYLWYGIGAFLVKYPGYRYLFGPVSISNSFPKPARDLLVFFYKLYFSSKEPIAHSRQPYGIADDTMQTLKGTFSGDNYKEDFTQLKHLLANMGVSVPTLYKQYTEVAEPDGVRFLDFGVDPDFADCVDGLVLVDIEKLKKKKRNRYMGAAESGDTAA
ncbi:lysophospholipid acyltransferase family protein [Neiella marina]|uniref:L-ornithine N(alpha)-acyltransferase n=1 Tax=Neiella holothuriorum TaxID=2870530 RepID=A0ABS7EIZ9_9GAMM|nr:lysophospholipid acyltransferase family protein [Neiella holothuriorum]MBW8191858.1 lysophospholipid acyltransferase family protein [Neiella holothuriorum]